MEIPYKVLLRECMRGLLSSLSILQQQKATHQAFITLEKLKRRIALQLVLIANRSGPLLALKEPVKLAVGQDSK